MSADMKAAMEQLVKLREQWSGEHHHGLTFGNTKDLVEQFAAAFLEAEADIEKFRQAEIRWMDEAAAKDAELEQERASKMKWVDSATEKADELEQERKVRVKAESESAHHFTIRRETEQRAADLQRKLEEVEAATI